MVKHKVVGQRNILYSQCLSCLFLVWIFARTWYFSPWWTVGCFILKDEERKQYTGDGSVDFKGRRVLKQNTGNWKACPFILGKFCHCLRLKRLFFFVDCIFM